MSLTLKGDSIVISFAIVIKVVFLASLGAQAKIVLYETNEKAHASTVANKSSEN